MTGEELKDLLQDEGISQSELARKLNMSHQAFNQALKVADVKSGFLEKIAMALGKDMSMFYAGAGSVTTHGDNNTVQVGNNNSCSADDDEDLEDLCSSLKEEIDYLKKQNEKLMSWIDKLIHGN